MNNLTDLDINLIERRLDNQLSKLELQFFNERLRSDPAFKEGFDSYQDAITAIYLASEVDVMTILKAEQAKLTSYIKSSTHVKPLRPVYKPPILRGWLAAASIAVLGVAVYWIAFKNDDNMPEKLLATYYEPKINTWTKSLRDNEESERQNKKPSKSMAK